ncbi:hypothetical protein [Mesorhizobium sp. M2C.T.Ca.TU.002.02.1.1]|uniref:hypothetical protein n=1 Tax=Mesorhizobium sp. M2C.T.Ca.TU.002.02.1.1 TaxID=2496788 RepID=UPI000FCA6801|nr:hypothetical protein [Mesorhizobium sp. M2C.T.Ca.TU.002.02.1.1]RUU59940.1 hypothetical protein EOD07_05610 [Mesorhizobium sp. M2C.T.Ca.TU.002.02.1.1]RUU63594.1 hypothetical protein EOD04_22545 [Mesorhizobium sp. M2C.T.Ca.TU.009.01.2.1]
MTNNTQSGISVPLPRITEVSPHFESHAVLDNRDAPVFRKGEYVIADPSDTVVMDGSIVLVEWSSGRRCLMSTRSTAGEWSEHSVSVRKDGPHLVWWFDPIVRPRDQAEAEAWIKAGRIQGTSDGPYRAEHMREKTIGRVVGVAASVEVTKWAIERCAKRNREVDLRARRAARGFDPDLYVQLFDKIGQVFVIHDSPRGSGILGRIINGCDFGEKSQIYQDYAAVFAARRDGLDHSNRKLEAALRKAGRVITWGDGQWHVDPKMPDHVRAVYAPPMSEGGRHA